jgi:hypothetical protein
LWWATDLLASEYGWSKQNIFFETYPDELVYLSKRIRMRQIAEYKMQLLIASNPHTKNPRELWDTLDGQIDDPISDTMDRQGMENLKRMLSNSKAFVVK